MCGMILLMGDDVWDGGPATRILSIYSHLITGGGPKRNVPYLILIQAPFGTSPGTSIPSSDPPTGWQAILLSHSPINVPPLVPCTPAHLTRYLPGT